MIHVQTPIPPLVSQRRLSSMRSTSQDALGQLNLPKRDWKYAQSTPLIIFGLCQQALAASSGHFALWTVHCVNLRPYHAFTCTASPWRDSPTHWAKRSTILNYYQKGVMTSLWSVSSFPEPCRPEYAHGIDNGHIRSISYHPCNAISQRATTPYIAS
jgi:hypothetical protein